MGATNPTYSPTERLPLEITVDIPAFAFVTHLGSLCLAGKQAAGITDVAVKSGEKIGVITAQTALLKIKEELAKGDLIVSNDASYGVKAATTGDFVNAIALMSGISDDVIEVELAKFKL